MGEEQAAGQKAAGQDADGPEEESAAEGVPASRSANQAGEQPVPASHHEERRQEAVVRNEQLAAESVPDEPRGSRDHPTQAPKGG
jgi:hypothetical protein